MGRDYRPTLKAAAGLFEHAEQITQRVRANTDSAIAELCAAEEADARHVAAVSEGGEAFGQVVGGCKHLPSSAEHTHQAATDVKAAHRRQGRPPGGVRPGPRRHHLKGPRGQARLLPAPLPPQHPNCASRTTV
ncbi:hypothetical protein ACGFSG_16725 [Streptomyces sp. NPDC048512]|uniref:hypothetical protein n=1 Tax=Streptomyces sp. NPDC048512 TaxID=3365563 RepID=UPI00371FD2D1